MQTNLKFILLPINSKFNSRTLYNTTKSALQKFSFYLFRRYCSRTSRQLQVIEIVFFNFTNLYKHSSCSKSRNTSTQNDVPPPIFRCPDTILDMRNVWKKKIAAPGYFQKRFVVVQTSSIINSFFSPPTIIFFHHNRLHRQYLYICKTYRYQRIF